MDNVRHKCEQCGKRKHSFWEDTVGDIVSYLCEQQRWVKQIIVMAHNAKVFDFHFILNRDVILKSLPELIMIGPKFLCIKFEHMKFIDSVCLLPFPLRKLSSAFG